MSDLTNKLRVYFEKTASIVSSLAKHNLKKLLRENKSIRSTPREILQHEERLTALGRMRKHIEKERGDIPVIKPVSNNSLFRGTSGGPHDSSPQVRAAFKASPEDLIKGPLTNNTENYLWVSAIPHQEFGPNIWHAMSDAPVKWRLMDRTPVSLLSHNRMIKKLLESGIVKPSQYIKGMKELSSFSNWPLPNGIYRSPLNTRVLTHAKQKGNPGVLESVVRRKDFPENRFSKVDVEYPKYRYGKQYYADDQLVAYDPYAVTNMDFYLGGVRSKAQ